MAKDVFQINAGVKLCSSCEHNIRCIECFYKERYEALSEKHDAYIDENQRLREELNIVKAKAIKEFAYRLRIKIGFSNLMKLEWLARIIRKIEEEMAGAE